VYERTAHSVREQLLGGKHIVNGAVWGRVAVCSTTGILSWRTKTNWFSRLPRGQSKSFSRRSTYIVRQS